MSKAITMPAAKREGSGKGTARAVRRTNQIPAVIYGDNKAPVAISLDNKTMTLEYLKGRLFTTLMNLEVDGAKHLVLARDVQLDPVTDNILHVDFLRVTAKTKLRVSVPVQFINQELAPGIKLGGTISTIMHEVSLMCPANDIPDAIEVDLTGFELAQTVKLSDLVLPKGVTHAVPDADAHTVASILAPRSLKASTEEVAAADAAATEKKG